MQETANLAAGTRTRLVVLPNTVRFKLCLYYTYGLAGNLGRAPAQVEIEFMAAS